MAKLNTFLTRSGVDAIRKGHPWILAKQLKPDYKLPKSPAVVPLGEHWFWYSPKSEIRLRRMGPATRFWPTENIAKEEEDNREIITSIDDFAKEFKNPIIAELSNIYKSKQLALDGEVALRWIFGDSDGFGGLVVDIFENQAVAQIQSAPIEFFWPEIKNYLQIAWQKVQGDSGVVPKDLKIIEHRDGAIRKREGLKVLDYAPEDNEIILNWNSLQWHFNPSGNQKTGAYLDQKDNHLRAVNWAKRLQCKNAWDICSFEGGFAIHLAKAGLEVCAVDSSQGALDRGQKNAALNNCQQNLSMQKSDAFEFLRAKHKNKQAVDMIILDPPAFAPNKKSINNALKAYRELNLRAIHCLKSGGLLVSCSCSHVISQAIFLDMISQAEHHTRRKLRILEICGPSCDHTPSLQLPESDYLQAYFIQVI